MTYWTSSSGLIEIDIPLDQAQAATHPGPCDTDVFILSQVPAIREQLETIDPATLANELEGYGAWSTEELGNHEQNLQRVLWIACGDITEENAT
jgi:hypothetical protein